MTSTNFARNQIADRVFGSVAFTPPASYFLGLSTTTISSSGSNATEPVGASYARIEMPNDKSYFTYATAGCIVNSASLVFAESSGSWGTILNLALYDTITSGSIWFYTSLSPTKIVQDATTVSFSASSIAFSVT